MELFKIFGTIGLKGVDQVKSDLTGVTNQAESSSSKMSGTFKKLGGVIAGVFAVNKIKDFGVAMVQTSANVQAENAQFEASFGDLKNSATDMFNRVGEATGVFATRLKTTGTKAYSQLKGAGMDANEALKQTELFLNLASDASAYYDISLEDAEARIRSFMRGNVEAGDAIGLFTSESQRNTNALEMYGRKWIELTEAEKQNLMLGVAESIYTQSGALGQAQRESDGLANVTGNLKETWRQFLAVIGQPVLEAVIPIMQTLTDKVKQLKTYIDEHPEVLERVKNAVGVVVDAFMNLGAMIFNVIDWFSKHKAITEALISTLGVLVTAMLAFKAGAMIQGVINMWQQAQVTLALYSATTQGASIAQGFLNGQLTFGEVIVGLLTGKITLAQLATTLWTHAQNALNVALNANPIGIVIMAIGALIAIGVVLYKHCDKFKAFVHKAVDFFKNNWQTILLFMVNPFWGAFKLLYDKCEGFRNFINSFVNKIKQAFMKIVDFFKNNWQTILLFLINPFWGGFKLLYDKCDAFRNKVNQIINFFKTNWKSILLLLVNPFAGAFKLLYDKCDKFRNFFDNIINKIKGTWNKFCNFIKNAIKLPHFKFSGSMNPKEWFKGNVPKIGVEWYAEGGIMTQPTAFGYNPLTGNTMVGGEAGAEAIVPIDRLQGYVSNAVKQETSDLAYGINKLIDLLATYLPDIKDNMERPLVLDSGAVVGGIARKMDNKLGDIMTTKSRYGV